MGVDLATFAHAVGIFTAAFIGGLVGLIMYDIFTWRKR